MSILRCMIWNALRLFHRQVQVFLRVFMFVSLRAAIVGRAMRFTGISYLCDSAVFWLTPEGRTHTLID